MLDESHLSYWSLDRNWARTLPASPVNPGDLLFTADGRTLVSCHEDGVYLWPLGRTGAPDGRVDGLAGACIDLDAHPGGDDLLVGHEKNRVSLLSASTGRHRELYRGGEGLIVGSVAFDREGARAAMGPRRDSLDTKAIRLWELDNGGEPEVVRFWETETPGPGQPSVVDLAFAPDGSLYSGGYGGLRRWDRTTGWSTLHDAGYLRAQVGAEGRRILVTAGDWMRPTSGRWFAGETTLELLDLGADTGWRRIESHGTSIQTAVFDRTGELVVTGDLDGTVRVGPVTGEKPLRLVGHEATASAVTISPDGRWVVSAAGSEIKLWPIHDLPQRQLHEMSHRELLETLRSLTNLRAAPDPASPNGWKVEAEAADASTS